MIKVCENPGYRLLTMGFGALLVFSSFDKIAHPVAFVEMVENYQVIGKSLSLWVAVWIPATEILLGLMLIFGLWPAEGLLLNAGLMSGFFLLVSQAYLRGLDIECGCYGGEGSTIGPFKILQNIVLAALSIWLWIRVRAFKLKLEKSS
ncbi:hypothetical protein HQ585_19460 [candidate division KSB1 bacterium]|nr:hypothetical protein [candidate division KSB1 bacterium]